MMEARKKLKGLLSRDDFEKAARSYLPQVLFAYLSGGVEDNISLDRNKAAFHELGFVPRIMRDVSSVDIQAELWGETYAAPFGIAPMGLSALTAFKGNLVQARLDGRMNFPINLSGSSPTQ